MSQIALYIVIYKFIYNYIEAEKAVFIFLNDLMTNDLNDYLSVFSQRMNDVGNEEEKIGEGRKKQWLRGSFNGKIVPLCLDMCLLAQEQ